MVVGTCGRGLDNVFKMPPMERAPLWSYSPVYSSTGSTYEKWASDLQPALFTRPKAGFRSQKQRWWGVRQGHRLTAVCPLRCFSACWRIKKKKKGRLWVRISSLRSLKWPQFSSPQDIQHHKQGAVYVLEWRAGSFLPTCTGATKTHTEKPQFLHGCLFVVQMFNWTLNRNRKAERGGIQRTRFILIALHPVSAFWLLALDSNASRATPPIYGRMVRTA